jgi:hypothetical protein
MINMTRDEMVEKLRTCICEVTFTKVDGEKRVMNCSLNNALIPTYLQPTGKPVAKVLENLDVIRVYDVDNAGWRSFRIDGVESFTHINGVQNV